MPPACRRLGRRGRLGRSHLAPASVPHRSAVRCIVGRLPRPIGWGSRLASQSAMQTPCEPSPCPVEDAVVCRAWLRVSGPSHSVDEPTTISRQSVSQCFSRTPCVALDAVVRVRVRPSRSPTPAGPPPVGFSSRLRPSGIPCLRSGLQLDIGYCASSPRGARREVSAR